MVLYASSMAKVATGFAVISSRGSEVLSDCSKKIYKASLAALYFAAMGIRIVTAAYFAFNRPKISHHSPGVTWSFSSLVMLGLLFRGKGLARWLYSLQLAALNFKPYVKR